MKQIQVLDDPQGSEEWFANRAGIPTASMFGVVQMKPGPRGGVPKTRQKYLYRLAAERISGIPVETYSGIHMERGKIEEEEAADLYALIRGVELETVGFIRRSGYGASPDRLVGKHGLLEIKTAKGDIQVERLLKGQIPPEHVPQVQGQLMVTGRKWCDFMSYSRGLPPLILRVHRDTDYMKALREDLKDFLDELVALERKIRKL